MADQRIIASKFSRAAMGCSPPDVIIAAFPVIELCASAVDYGEKMLVPVLLDMRDMWPDIFLELVPPWGRRIARCILAPQFHQSETACSRATAIMGITEPFVEWGLARGKRPRTALDRAFPLAYAPQTVPEQQLADAQRFWDSKLASYPEYDLCACFVGSLGHSLDVGTLINAAGLTHTAQEARVLFVICGTGDFEQQLRKKAAALPNVVFAGWVDAPRFQALKTRAHVGLDPLPARFDFLATINNKAIEYLSAGLPVLSSPERGLLANLVDRKQCGLTYPSGDFARLAQILSHLSRDSALLNRMSTNARNAFREQFEADLVHSRMCTHLEDVVASYRAHRAAR